MQVVRQSGRSKKLVSSTVPSFSGNKYNTTVTTVCSGVNFAFPFMHPDIQMRSNQGPDWDHVIHYAMIQIYMKAVMKIFGTRRVLSVSNKLKKPHLRNKFETLYPRTLVK